MATVSGTGTTANSGGLSVSITGGDIINLVTEPVSSPTAPTRMRMAAVMSIPPAAATTQGVQVLVNGLVNVLLNGNATWVIP